MKIFLKILLISIISLLFLFAAAYLFIALKGKSIIAGQLENLTHKKVSIGYFRLTPPFKLELKNLEIEGLLKADYISISPNIPAFLRGNIGFNEVRIIKPEITYEKLLPAAPDLSAAAPILAEQTIATVVSSLTAPSLTMPKKNIRFPLIFKHINVTEGKIDFFDHTVGAEGIKITVKDIFFHLSNLYMVSRPVITNFELNGNIPWQEGEEEGRVTAEGWLDLFKKDMRASLKISGIDGVYLYPYYSQWVDLEKARIEKAKLNFISNINGLNNEVTAECHMELSDIVFKERTPEEQQEKAEKIAYAILDIFKALNQGKIVLDFTIRTKMDRPQFGFGAIKGAVEDKIASSKKAERPIVGDVFALPIKLLEGAVKASSDLSKAAIDGAFAVGNELKKAVEDSFKKER